MIASYVCSGSEWGRWYAVVSKGRTPGPIVRASTMAKPARLCDYSTDADATQRIWVRRSVQIGPETTRFLPYAKNATGKPVMVGFDPNGKLSIGVETGL